MDKVEIKLSDGAMASIWSIAASLIAAEYGAVRSQGAEPTMSKETIRGALSMATEMFVGSVTTLHEEPVEASVGKYVHAELRADGVDGMLLTVWTDPLPDEDVERADGVLDLDVFRRKVGK